MRPKNQSGKKLLAAEQVKFFTSEILCCLFCFLFINSNIAFARQLSVTITDPVGDGSPIDIIKVVVIFNTDDGSYSLTWTSSEEKPFVGSFFITQYIANERRQHIINFGRYTEFQELESTTELTISGIHIGFRDTGYSIDDWRVGDPVATTGYYDNVGFISFMRLITEDTENPVSSEASIGTISNIDGYITDDFDGDGIPDDFELSNGLDFTSAVDGTIDSDLDGLTNFEEFVFGSNITQADMDGDGLIDSQEFQLKTNPDNNDSDADGVEDFLEFQIGRNPAVNEIAVILLINSIVQ